MTSDDYLNDLMTRDVLGEIAGMSSPEAAAELERVLAPIDQRVKGETVEALRPALPIGAGWWKNRIPKRMAGDLLDDLRWQIL